MRVGHRGREDGTILILTIGFVVIAMLLVWAVVDASAVFLDRRDLAAAVDGTALAAAQQVDVDALYAQGVGSGDLPLDPVAVRRAVDTYVGANFPPIGYPGWRISGAASGPRTVTVTGTRTVRLPVFGTITINATATATDRTGGELP